MEMTCSKAGYQYSFPWLDIFSAKSVKIELVGSLMWLRFTIARPILESPTKQ